jgi:pyrroloquinoline quinone biosynthesis protein E
MLNAMPRLAPKTRLRWDASTKAYLLIYPERGLALNDVAAFVLLRCDGHTRLADTVDALRAAYADVPEDVDALVLKLCGDLAARAVLEGFAPSDTPAHNPGTSALAKALEAPRPFTLIAELTHRCPLQCAYCSNPVELQAAELPLDIWKRVLDEAASLGVVQLHLTGGEPLLYPALPALATHARAVGLYTNLITSGLGAKALQDVLDAGVDNVQVSVQDLDLDVAERVAGKAARRLSEKLEAAATVKTRGLPLTLNVVLHRDNIDRTARFIELGQHLGADRIELANTQYLGWAHTNKQWLLPTAEQVRHAAEVAREAKAALRGRVELLFVKPDHFGETPRACMDGWARRFLHITPGGDILPCHAAASLPGFELPNVQRSSLIEAWSHSALFNAYRGDHWMREPCRSCELKSIDFGGCRCQAFAILGDATATDPACGRSPERTRLVMPRRQAPLVTLRPQKPRA